MICCHDGRKPIRALYDFISCMYMSSILNRNYNDTCTAFQFIARWWHNGGGATGTLTLQGERLMLQPPHSWHGVGSSSDDQGALQGGHQDGG